jgi:hypothetical protein
LIPIDAGRRKWTNIGLCGGRTAGLADRGDINQFFWEDDYLKVNPLNRAAGASNLVEGLARSQRFPF